MVPAISFAYENAELDIMDRAPRMAKRDHLVNAKLISYSYLQIGVIQGAAGMYTYMLVLNDYGIRPRALWGLAKIQAPMPADTDIYDLNNNVQNSDGVYTTRYGNTRVNEPVPADLIDEGHEKLGWDLTKHGKVDVRLYYAMDREPEMWTKCRWAPNDESIPKLYRYSNVTDYPICYTTEALKYAQAAYLVSIVTV